MSRPNPPLQFFSSRLGLLLSVLGIAVGTGNIWRFPRIVAQNGSGEGAGAFLVAWILFLVLWSIPLIIAEYAMGRESRMGTIGAFARLSGRGTAWMGAFVGFVATAIMFYYSVVAGWCVYYLVGTAARPLPLSTEAAQAVWDGFQAGNWPLVFHALAMGLGGLVCLRGVRSIERVNKVLVPTLVVVVLIAVVRALTLPGSFDGIRYLFTPDWSLLGEPTIWLEALTQNAWDTGAGWGLILTYAAYMRANQGVVKNAVITAVGNNTVSLLAATMIFGIVFATLGSTMTRPEILDVMRQSGPASTGLTFIWMPQLFAEMAFGRVLAVLFFLGLSFAAFSSLISMIELATRNLVDLNWSRPRATGIVCVAGFVFGMPSALRLGFLGNQDFVWGVALMISGAFVAWAVSRYGVDRFREAARAADPTDWELGAGWSFLIRVLVPLQAVVLLIWWMSLAATEYAPDRWFDPFEPYSLATCVVQWLVAIGVFLALNRLLARRTLGDEAGAARS